MIQSNNVFVSKSAKLEKFFQKISLKSFIFNVKCELTESELSDDDFLADFIMLLEKNKLNEDNLEKLSGNHPTRYEGSFLKMCFFMNEIKGSRRDSKMKNSTPVFIDKLLKILAISNERLKKGQYTFENTPTMFSFRPSTLLRLW